MGAIAWKSLLARWPTALLAVLAIAMSVALILGVEKVRRDARTSFANTLSGTDLIVGARGGGVQLLLYSVFRIGNATNNVSVQSAREIAARPAVAWTIPLSLGDSYRGYRVLGTSLDYFEHYRHGDDRTLAFAEGVAFDDVFDAVLGAEVARALGHGIGDPLVIAHGTGSTGVTRHEDTPFRVAGVLERTGTPVDETVHVSLEGIEALHVDWRSGMRVPGESTSPEAIREMARTAELEPTEITAMLVGLTSRARVFGEQRAINEYRAEPLLAILPGVALTELWNLVGIAGTALAIVSSFVVVAGLFNLVSVLLAGLQERRREMAILRASGAGPGHVFALLCLESLCLTAAGIAVGLAAHYAIVLLARDRVLERFGLQLPLGAPAAGDLLVLALVLVAGLLAGTVPAWRAYRLSLADGMTPRS